MYDHLDPLFFRQTPAPRHSEPVDTHMAIQRHEQPRDHHRGGRPPHEQAAESLWEDSTRMSVAMLRAFLQNLLAAQTPQQAGTGETGTSPAPPHDGDSETESHEREAGEKQQTNEPTNPARQAAQAYQSTARAVHDSNFDPWAATGPAIPDDAPTLNAHEIEVVQDMIRDLEKLEARYIETLEIKGTTNFLQSILDAIDLAMGRD